MQPCGRFCPSPLSELRIEWKKQSCQICMQFITLESAEREPRLKPIVL